MQIKSRRKKRNLRRLENERKIKKSIPLEVDSSGRSGYNVLPSSMVNAAYSGNQNSITIPGGILKFPFFSAERPFSINFGFIGVVIGHEFTHGLDDKGSKFDQFGNLRNWFGKEGLKQLRRLSRHRPPTGRATAVHIAAVHIEKNNRLAEFFVDFI